jgi:glycosyltransferase involved in cell wall biosynthesis
MKIKVCHMTSVHKRYDGRILMKECLSLKEHGLDVFLLVNDKDPDEDYKGVKIVSTEFDPINRLDRIISSSKKMYEKAIEIDADIYHFHDPELLIVANKLKKNKKLIIFDSHEDVPRDIEDKAWIPKFSRKVIAFLYTKYEEKSIKNYDALISVTPHIVERFRQTHQNVHMITNYPITSTQNSLKEYSSNKNICFAGAVNEAWNHEIVIDAIGDLDEVKYILAGPATESYLKKLQTFEGWRKVEYLGAIPKEEVVINIYNNSSIGMALNYSKQLEIGKGTLGNNKFFEYMQNKLPIICSDYELWKEIVEKNECGIAVNPNSKEEIKGAIKYLVSNPEIALKMGKNGHEAIVSKYNWENQAIVLKNIYDDLISKRL